MYDVKLVTVAVSCFYRVEPKLKNVKLFFLTISRHNSHPHKNNSYIFCIMTRPDINRIFHCIIYTYITLGSLAIVITQ